MRQIQKMSAGRKILLAIASATGIAGSQGCVQGVTVTPEVGYHQPTNQRSLEFGSSAVYGISAGVEFDNGIEVTANYNGHNTSYEDAIQRNEIQASDLSARVSVPFWRRAGHKIAGFLGIGSRNQTETMTWVGPTISEDTTSSLLSAGVSYEKELGAGRLGAELEADSLGDKSYEETGIKAKVFYKVFFKTK
jgi:hypothetical protein